MAAKKTAKPAAKKTTRAPAKSTKAANATKSVKPKAAKAAAAAKLAKAAKTAKTAKRTAQFALCSSVVVGPKRKAVLFAYRQEPDNDQDSGWRFLRGDESEAFLADASHCLVCPLDLVFTMDASLEALVSGPVGSAWKRAAEKDAWTQVEADYDPER
jgi:hypothetical protein